MEDARFVRFVDDDQVIYYATYTAFEGHQILPQLLETVDFTSFHVATLSGQAAQHKGMALFPRKIDGKYVALHKLRGPRSHPDTCPNDERVTNRATEKRLQSRRYAQRRLSTSLNKSHPSSVIQVPLEGAHSASAERRHPSRRRLAQIGASALSPGRR